MIKWGHIVQEWESAIQIKQSDTAPILCLINSYYIIRVYVVVCIVAYCVAGTFGACKLYSQIYAGIQFTLNIYNFVFVCLGAPPILDVKSCILYLRL